MASVLSLTKLAGRYRSRLASSYQVIRTNAIGVYRKNVRWRARVFVTRVHALVGICSAQRKVVLSYAEPLRVSWPPERQHGLGEVFAMLVCVRQLAALDFSINLEVVRPSSAFASFERYSETELDRWFHQAKLMTERMLKGLDKVAVHFAERRGDAPGNRPLTSLEQILASSWGLSPLSTMLYRYSRLRKKGAGATRLDHFKFSKQKLAELGLPEFFVAWNVRQNSSYRLSSNPSEAEVIKDFLALCRAQPLPIVLLSEPDGRSRVVRILTANATTSQLAHNRLITAKTNSYWHVLQTVWSSQAYFQRRGGGAGMAAIYSSIPYIIIFPNRDLMGRFHLGRKNRVAPWAVGGLQTGLIAEPSADHFRKVYTHLKDLG